MQYLSQLYDSKRLRGKAKEGYVRPTLREIFTADVFYEEIEKDTCPVDLTQYNNVIYVDSTNGNDTTGDGSESSPYATFDKANNQFSNGDAIKLNSGTYNNNLGDNNKNLTIIGENKNTFLNNDTYFGNSSNITTYNLIIDSTNARYNVVSRNANIEGYNCVFKSNVKATLFQAISYPGYMNVVLENCSMYLGDLTDDKIFYGQELVADITNCSTNALNWYRDFSFNWDIHSLSKNTSIIGVSYDSNWNITSSGWQNTGTGTNPDGSQAHIGVYGGQYAWE